MMRVKINNFNNFNFNSNTRLVGYSELVFLLKVSINFSTIFSMIFVEDNNQLKRPLEKSNFAYFNITMSCLSVSFDHKDHAKFCANF